MKTKKHILYIGNKLSGHNKSITAIETLGILLEKKYIITYASTKKNMFLRLLDMIGATLKKRGMIDVVLIDTYSTLNFYFALLISQICRALNIEYIPILRGGNLPEKIQRSKILTDLIFRHSKINVIPSAYLARIMEKNNYSYRIIPNNVEIKNYNYLERKKINPRILYVRAFHRIYNPLMAVKVLFSLKDSHPEVVLCMIGPDKDGSQQEVLELARKLGVQDSLETPGFLTKKEWHERSRDFDIFINTTDHDNTPISVIEAMALGLPVVSTNVGGVPFLVEQNKSGLLVEKNDHKAMSSAIKKLLDDPDLAHQIAGNAREKVEHFDWEVVKNDWFDIIDSTTVEHAKPL